MLHSLRTEIADRPIISTLPALHDYLRAEMAHGTSENFRVLFLNSKNHLLADELVSLGTIDEAPIYPREVMRRALELGTTALIMVHNHPSGDPQPSRSDIAVTRDIADAGRQLGIRVHDHLIVARTGVTSFRQLGLI